LGDICDDLIVAAQPQQLIDGGFLVPCEIIAPEQVLEPGTIAQDPVDAYQEHTPGRKAIVFATNVKAATEYRNGFERRGIKCGLITGETENRRQILNAFKSGEIKVVSSVAVLTEGFDEPSCDVCILARSCGSVSLYLQIVGRVLRAAKGKTHATLIDLYGASRIYGSPADDREYALEGDGIRRKEDLAVKHRFCAVCGTLIDPQAFVCGECATKRPELDVPYVVGVKLVKFAAIRKDTPEQRVARLAKWIKQARAAGHKPGKAYHRFRGAYGVPPSKSEWVAAMSDLTEI
jgi:superfamily II DNA or RNA helicase